MSTHAGAGATSPGADRRKAMRALAAIAFAVVAANGEVQPHVLENAMLEIAGETNEPIRWLGPCPGGGSSPTCGRLSCTCSPDGMEGAGTETAIVDQGSSCFASASGSTGSMFSRAQT